MKANHVLIFIFLICVYLKVEAQQKYIYLNHQLDFRVQSEVRSTKNLAHLSMRPYLESDKNLKRVEKVFIDSSKAYYWVTEKLNKDHLLKYKDSNFFLSGDFLFNFQFGYDYRDSIDTRITNTRGVIIRGDIGSKISFSTSFYENQVKGPKYWRRITGRGVFPGSGRYKQAGAKYDYAFSSAYVSFSPNQNLNIQIGHDKIYIGNGYRSMLLSDNAFNYPFAKATHSFFNGKIKYSYWLTKLSSLQRIELASTPETYFKPKAGTFNYLSYKPNGNLEIGLFESVIYNIYNDTLGTTPLNYSAYIPVYGVKTAINTLNNDNNAMLGLNLFYKINNNIQVYSQIAVDDISTNKFGFQVGGKWFEPLNVKGLYFQVEYNKATKNMYASSFDRQSYTHYSQELAHPYGAGFDEILGIVFYQKKKFFVQGKVISAFQLQLGDEYYGANVLDPIIENPSYEFLHHNTLNIQDLQIGYRYNVKTNMYFNFGVINRVYAAHKNFNNTLFFYAGFRTNLNNFYFDF